MINFINELKGKIGDAGIIALFIASVFIFSFIGYAIFK